MAEINEEVGVDTNTNAEDGSSNAQDNVALSKKEYEELLGYKTTAGSLKRELKDLKKAKEDTVETSSNQKPEESALLQKLERMSLRQAGLTDPEDVELARTTAKKWGVDLDEVLSDEDFKVKLERQQTARANAQATSKIRGGAGTSQAKNTPEFYIARGTPPTREEVPNGEARRKISTAFLKANKGGGKTFYND